MTEESMEKLPLKDPDESPVEKRKLGMEDQVKMIKFGKEFESWPDPRKIEYLKKLASAMNQAASDMQDERNKMIDAVKMQQTLCENAEKALEIQKKIVYNNLTASNAQNNKYIESIQRLNTRVKAQDKVIEELNKKLGNNP